MSSTFTRFVWSFIFLMMNWWNPAYSAFTSSSFSSSSDTRVYDSNAEEVEGGDNLLCKILICLPARSLLIFRCVSQKWNRIISSHEFRISHTKRIRHPPSTHLIMQQGQDWILLPHVNGQSHPQTITMLDLDYLEEDPGVAVTVISSCNGLSLCYVESLFMGYFAYYVTNITTRQFMEIPPPNNLPSHFTYQLTLAFDPIRAPHFKILCVGHFRRGQCIMVIYSSETCQWRRWNGQFINAMYMTDVFKRGVVWNGAIHWICPSGNSFYFSLDDEIMSILSVPPFTSDSHTTESVRLIGQSGGHLLFVDVEFNVLRSPPIKIYQMKDNYGGWTLIHRVDLYDLGVQFPGMIGQLHLDVDLYLDSNEIPLHPCIHYSFAVLSVIWVNDGESLDIILLIPQQIISYNTKTRIARVLFQCEESIKMHDYKWYDVFQFSDTLSWFTPSV